MCVFFRSIYIYIYIIKYPFSLWYVLRDICIEKLPLLNLLNPVLLHFYDPICLKSTKKEVEVAIKSQDLLPQDSTTLIM